MYLITYPVGLMGEKENDMEQKFCQSCGMPLTNEILGTNTDGTLNEDYCIYCYKDTNKPSAKANFICILPRRSI